MAASAKRRTLLLLPDGPVREGGNTMSAAVMTIQRRTWNGARAVLVALVVAVAILASILIFRDNTSSASSPTRSVTPVSQSQGSSPDIACGAGHPC